MTSHILLPNAASDHNAGGYNPTGGTFNGVLSDANDATSIIGSTTGTVYIPVAGYTMAAGSRCRAARVSVRAEWGYTGQTNDSYIALSGTFASGVVGAEVFAPIGSIGWFTGAWNTSWPAGGEISQAEVNAMEVRFRSTTLGTGGFGNLTARVIEAHVEIDVLAKPTVTVTGPTGTNPGSTHRPTVTWTSVIGDGYAQKGFQVKVYNKAVNASPAFADTLGKVYDSGFVGGTALSHIIASSLASANYRVMVEVAKDFNGSNWFSDASSIDFTITATPPTPTAITPSGTTEVSNTPVLGAHTTIVDGLASPPNTYVQWQLATDPAFSSGLITVTEPTSAANGGGTHAIAVPNSSPLHQTTWYLRARELDLNGNAGAYSSSVSFAVSHPPSATVVSPTGGTTLAGLSAELVWVFNTIVGSAQTAYQIIVEENTTGANVVDTGQVTDTATMYALTIDVSEQDVQLRWKVRVWDNDGIVGAYSDYGLFTLGNAPGLTVDAPTGTIDNPQPVVSWTPTYYGSRVQQSYRVQILDGSSVVVADSGIVFNTDMSWQVPAGKLFNSMSYTTLVVIVDSGGLSNFGGTSFSTSWTPPGAPAVVVDSANFDNNGYMDVSWSIGATDATFLFWRVYRALHGVTTYDLIYETDVAATLDYHDYFVANGVDYDYVVAQVADRFGVALESIYSPVEAVSPDSASYWILNPDDLTTSLHLRNCTDEGFTDETETAEMNVIGRGRHIETGTEWGYRGQLQGTFYDIDGGPTARVQRQMFVWLKRNTTSVSLRNPFGDIWKVSLGDAAISRIAGVGTREFCTFTIPYAEVY